MARNFTDTIGRAEENVMYCIDELDTFVHMSNVFRCDHEEQLAEFHHFCFGAAIGDNQNVLKLQRANGCARSEVEKLASAN